MRPATCTIYCIDGRREDVGVHAAHLAICHRLRESLGPRVNVVPVPARPDPLGRGGLTTRTVYEIGLFGHGVVVCGEADGPPDDEPALEVDPEALRDLDVPLLLCGFTERMAGLPPAAVSALAARATVAVAADAVAARHLREAGAADVVLGGAPALFVDRVETGAVAADDPGGVLLAIRDPATLPIPAPRRAAVRDLVRRLLTRLRDEGHRDVRLLCQSPEDLAFAAALSDVDHAYTEDPYVWLGLLRRAALVVSWRLEAALACAATGTPFVHLAVDPAPRRALEPAGLADRVLAIEPAPASPDPPADPVDAARAAWLRALADAEDRLRALPAWATLDRDTGAAFNRFAQAVRHCRDDEAARRRAHARLPPESSLVPFEPQQTVAD